MKKTGNITTLFVLIAIVLGWSFQASAENLKDTKSPYALLQQMSVQEKQEFIGQWNQWVAEQNVSKSQKEALKALVTFNKELSGPSVLENVDSDIVNWFYGLESSAKPLLHKVAKISKHADVETCRAYSLCVVVTKSTQSMTAYFNGQPMAGLSAVPVSTARRGKYTPTGLFTVQELGNVHSRSGRYHGAYMGYRMQIQGHYFLHATSKKYYKRLGRRASAGCVRMTLGQAKKLNKLMRQLGRSNVRVVVR